MYRQRAPLAFLAVLFAAVGGILLVRSHWVGGAILLVLALVAAAGNYQDEDGSGLY